MKKKIKIKKQPIIILIIVVLIILFTKNALNKNRINIEKLVNSKIKSEEITVEFVKWVNDKYPNSIKELNKLLEKEDYNKDMWHQITGYSYLVLDDLYSNNKDNIKVLDKDTSTISIVGDVSLADNWSIIPKYDEREKGIKGILSSEIIDIMTKSDVMIVNSEFTVSNRGEAIKGKQYTFRAKLERLAIYNEMGVDMVTLANNHVYDFGQDAFLDMLDEFDKIKMPRIGAGHNLEEAMKPYYFVVNGYKVGFLNATRAEKYILTPGATDTSEGVFRCYDPTNMINQIKKVRKEADYVVAIIHFGKEGYHDLEEEQISSSHQYIDAGADIVVGHHAHVLQGVEIYNNKPIIYNLGNFIFNEETLDTAIFQLKINNSELTYKMIPAKQHNEYTELLKGDEKQRVINELNEWSINAYIDENGIIKLKN